MLAYVFVHRPADGEDPAAYEAGLVAFHRALAAAPPGGFLRSWSWRTRGGVEDWYLVDGWAALGALNEAAVRGPRQPAHDAVAARAGEGAGAVYGLLSGEPTAAAGLRLRASKPRGVPYAAFEADLVERAGPGAAVWKRQMVLGPDLEFLVNGPVGEEALTVVGSR